jgi:riboflavin biosynthesis pyrimidine reductase
VRQLLPSWVPDADPGPVYGGPRPTRADRPWVMANMVASTDGSATVEGRSGGLGGPADRLLFRLLRARTDLVLVAAGTVRAEGYGPVRLPEDLRAARAAAGRPPVPAIAVVSGSLALDWSSPLFTAAQVRPLVVTARSSAGNDQAAAARVADVVVAGDERVDLGEALTALGARGHQLVLCEGGPSLLGQLVSGGLVDELCLTVAARLAGGDGPRIVRGPALVPPAELTLATAFEDDSHLFLRYLPAGPG